MKLAGVIGYLGWMLVAMALPAGAESVEQWGVYEIKLTGPATGNPFVEVQVAAEFTQGGTMVRVNGFYDGEGVYRVRFMPEKTGEWTWQTRSNARELDGHCGTFTVVPAGPHDHGPVRVAHTYHFAYADGTPYKPLGTTCYAWTQQGPELEAATLATLAASPFNKLRMCVFPKRYDWNTNEPPQYPFAGTPTTNWDFTRFNPAYFQHLEQRILDLQKLGIEADVILFHPYDGGHWGFDRMPAAADDRYLRYVTARLAAFRNVWWSLANEYDFMKEKKESDFVRFGGILTQEDPYHHLISIHNGQLMFNHTLPFITHASIQNGSAVEDAGRAELFRDVYRKPVVFDEVKYEGNLPRRWGNLSAEELVFRFWEGTVAGTYVGHGETYLSPDNIIWWSKGGALKGQSPARLAFLKQVLDDAPAEGIDPIDKWQSPAYGGQAPNYYLIYLGKQTPASWEFLLPKPPLGAGQPAAEGMQFTAEVLDTWNMTVTPVPGRFVLHKRDNYSYVDRDGRAIELPGRPYMAIRLKRVND